MKFEANTVEEYLAQLPDDRKLAIEKLRQVVLKNLPTGFEETINYGMIGYVVPLSTYPQGYLDNANQPLPFIAIASQKNFIAFYHMGLVVDKKLLEWFIDEYTKLCKTKLDMGKSCIRLKKTDQIPYELLGKSVSKITPEQWITIYEKSRESNKTSKK